MTIVKSDIYIAATPDQVDALASDPKRWPDWYANIEKIRIDPLFPEVGGKVEITFNIVGVVFKVRFTQQEFIPARKSVCTIDGRFKGTSQFMVSDEESGARAFMVLDYSVPGGFLGGIANSVFIKDTIQGNLDTSLHNLKSLVESEI
jgi:hypothetical protein